MWSALTHIKAREVKRRSDYLCTIDLYGLASVMTAILVFLMVATTQHRDLRGGPDLAEAQHAESVHSALREDAIRITVARDGNIYFGTSEIHIHDLPNAIRTAVHAGSERTVYLVVDARARYGDVEAVIDELQSARISDAVFLTRRSDKPTSDFPVR
ncbi:MAG: biopolymer transporter ExbD [Candidatus Acidiferrales bacterium]